MLCLDAAVFGIPRPAVLEHLLAVGRAFVLVENGRVVGYAIERAFGRGSVVGPVVAATEPDAGQPLDPFGPGASVADLNKQNGGCLMDNEPFTEQGTGVAGTVYRVAPSDACRGKLPGLSGQIVLVVDGKIYRRAADPRPPPPPPSATATAARPPAAGARPGPPPGGSPPAPAAQAQQPQ